MMRSSLLAATALVLWAAPASAGSLNLSFADPSGDAQPNLGSIDIVAVVAHVEDARIAADVQVQGVIDPEGNEYVCVADLNPDLPMHPRYELTFAGNRFGSTFRTGDSSPHSVSTEGAAWSEQGLHLTAKRAETNAVTKWDARCETKHLNADGSKTGDLADPNSMPAQPKSKGMAPGLATVAVLAAWVGLAWARRRT